MVEIWVDVKDYEGLYKISNLGEILSCKTGKLRSLDRSRLYLGVNLFKNGETKKFNVHRLVAKHFVKNEDTSVNNIVNHLDGNKFNNIATNLEWTTSSGNAKHALRTGLFIPKVGERCTYSKLKDRDIYEIVRLLQNGLSQTEVSKQFNISISAINSIINNRRWKHLNIEVDESKLVKKTAPKKIKDQFGNIYNSITEAAKITKNSIGNISMVLYNKRKHAKNYVFTFVKEKKSE